MTFSELTDRPKCFKYGDHPRIRRKTGKRIMREQKNNGIKTSLQQLMMLDREDRLFYEETPLFFILNSSAIILSGPGSLFLAFLWQKG